MSANEKCGFRAIKSLLCASLCLVGGAWANGAVRTWNGPAGGDLLSGDNWLPTGELQASDELHLTDADAVATSQLTVAKIVIDGASRVTFKATSIDKDEEWTPYTIFEKPTVITVTGLMEIGGTSVVTTANDPVTGAAVKLAVGSMTLGADAKITADGKGWDWYEGTDDKYMYVSASGYQTRGQGTGLTYQFFAGHGAAGSPTWNKYGVAYGLPYAPFQPGSPNGRYSDTSSRPGGGTVWIHCSGVFTLSGVISACGDGTGFYGTPSGGGIWIAARGFEVSSTAELHADGGTGSSTSYHYGYSAGGRVSIAVGLTDEELASLAQGVSPQTLGLTAQDSISMVTATASSGYSMKTKTTGTNHGTCTTVIGTHGLESVSIAGDPLQATGVDPAYGTYSKEKGSVFRLTAPEYGMSSDSDLVRYPCLGYVLTTPAGETTSTDRTLDLTVPAGPITVTWRWGAAQSAVVFRKPAHASLVVGGIVQSGDVTQWKSDALDPVEVRPDAGYEFLGWEGPVPCGNARANPLSFVPTEPAELTAVVRPSEAAATRTWSGEGVWTDVSHWTPANLPGRGDKVVIADGRCEASNFFAVGSVEMTGGALWIGTAGNVSAELSVFGDLAVSDGAITVGQARMAKHARWQVGGDLTAGGQAVLTAYSGPTDATYTAARGSTEFAVAGDLILEGAATLIPVSEAVSGGSVKVSARRLAVAEGAQVNADKCGWRWLDAETRPKAPGMGGDYRYGSSHGGVGGVNNAGLVPVSAYGYSYSPVLPGSAGAGNEGGLANALPAGGGLVRIHAREIEINGRVSADAQSNAYYEGASGGGIWLTADTFKFGANAVLSAKGGKSDHYGSHGAGGRIAIGYRHSASDIEALAATGVWGRCKDKRICNEDIFRQKVGNASMTVDVSSFGRTETVDYPGTFFFLDDTRFGLVITVR